MGACRDTFYVTKADRPGLVDTDQALRLFSGEKGRARRLYLAYTGEGGAASKDDIYRTVDQRVLGDEGFAEEVKKEKYKLQLATTRSAERRTFIAGRSPRA
ncbi:MAG: hypothetical protein MZV70_00930 [Desulfobacterales bacterium]|nr:hypothetical protein [Desulfobacterales bacterium]